ncbi:hypothetical protein Tco_0744504 [Tanacetum coccineum]
MICSQANLFNRFPVTLAKDPLTWLATSCESTKTVTSSIFISLAMRSPAMTASYSASLLVAVNLNFKAYVNSVPSGLTIIKPTQSHHHLMLFSARKSVRIWALTAFLGLNSISCSPSSMAHLATLPDFPGFDNRSLIGLFVVEATGTKNCEDHSQENYENFAASSQEGLDKTYYSSKDQASTASYADDVMFSFFANQSNAPQLEYEDLEQIDADDLEDVDLKWQVAMLTIRVKRLNATTAIGGVILPKNEGHQGIRGIEIEMLQQGAQVDTSTINALVVQNGMVGYDWSFWMEETKAYKLYSNGLLHPKYDIQVKDISIKDLKNQLEEVLKEKDDLKLKLEKFEESSKNITKLINSQISAKDTAGLGYDSQMNESEVVHSVFNSKESDMDESPVNDRFKTGEGFHAVPPPYLGEYIPSRPDLSFARILLNKPNNCSRPRDPIIEEWRLDSVNDSVLEKPKTVRPSAPIIEDWDTDSDNDSVFRPKTDQTKPKFTKINFVKSDENVKSVNKENTHKQVEYPRKSQSPRGNRRNWNGMMTQKLGNGFEFIKKACFVCRSFNHLIKECDFHDNKMVEKTVLNNKGRITGQREIRRVWNNVQRVNHQNKLTHPHPKRKLVPTAVAIKLGQVPVNAAKQNSPRAASSISTTRPVNTAAPKSKVNDALPKTYSYFKAHSPVRRDFNQKSAAKTYNLNEKVKTAKVNNVTTAGPKAVVSATVGYGENTVKSLVCWIWIPTGNVIDHTSKDRGSYMFTRFYYVNLQGRLNGCSRHMTGNKSFLTDYQDVDGGFVAFAGSPKGGKITRKGKIRTGKLDFEDVYFVKELKFNLFSVS